MVDTPSLMFERLRNGESDTFPSYASGICFLDGHPDLLHIWKDIGSGDQADIIRVGTYRNGTYCSLFTTEARTDNTWARQSNGNTNSFTFLDSNTGAFIAYENGSFRAEIVTSALKDIKGFIRAGDSNYFYNNEFMSSNSTQTSLQWEKLPGVYNVTMRVMGQYIMVFHMFRESTSVVNYELVNGTYRKRGDTPFPFTTFAVTTIGVNYVLCQGAFELAVIDCSRMEAARFTFNVLPGNIERTAARFVGGDAVEIYIATKENGQCMIYKTSMSFQMLETRFESKRIAKILDLTSRLRSAEISSEQFGTELKLVQERYAAQEKKIAHEMKKNAELKETVTAMNSTISNLQASLESLEKKYSSVLLLLSRKNSGA